MGYIALIVGAGITVLFQSSSVFTSTLTPLVGMGAVTLDRVYPLTLGSNIGTTVTSILAAFSAGADAIRQTLQIALVHLFFNISGIIMFYPIPITRQAPIRLAKKLGYTTARYRWFAVAYLILVFFVFPGIVFGLSVLGPAVLFGVGGPILAFIIAIIIINVIQDRCPGYLPNFLQSWSWLPLPLHSLEPWDRLFTSCCPCCPKNKDINAVEATPETIAAVQMNALGNTQVNAPKARNVENGGADTKC